MKRLVLILAASLASSYVQAQSSYVGFHLSAIASSRFETQLQFALTEGSMKTRWSFREAFTVRFVQLVAVLAMLATSRGEEQALILGYHHIGVSNGVTQEVSQVELERQLRSLLALGYVFVTTGRALETLETVPLVASVTFDDGYADAYSEALPVLRRLGIPATVFIIVARVNEPGFMSWEQLKVLRSAGWEVASHTVSHAELTDLSPTGLERELLGAKETLMLRLGSPVHCVAYPFGRHDRRVRQAAAMTYDCGVTTAPGLNTKRADAWALRRPLTSPLDVQGLSWRAGSGTDLRVALLAPAFAYWLLPAGAEGRRPAFYNPARYELMGDGQLGFRWQGGNLYQDVFLRTGDFATSAIFSRLGTGYVEVTGTIHLAVAAFGIGWSTEGAVLATALPLGGYGEVWGRMSVQTWALGAELIPLDYARLKTEVNSDRGFSMEVGFAPPVMVAEGRPLRMFSGLDGSWYGGSSLRLGGLETSLSVDATGAVGLAFTSSW